VLAPSQATAYRAFLERLANNSGVGFILRSRGGRFAPTSGRGGLAWGWVAWALIITLLAVARCVGAT
jgi:hypothetical protein